MGIQKKQMIGRKLKLAVLVICFLSFLLKADFASALKPPEIQYPQIPLSDVETPNQFIERLMAAEGTEEYKPGDALGLYIRYFYSLAIILAVLAVFASIIYGGFQYLLAVGKPGLLTIARDRISSGILGLIILFSVQFILTAINPQFSVFNFTAPEPESCNCTRPQEQLSDYCKVYCQVRQPITEETPVYIEIPLGRLVERVLKASEEAESVASTTNRIAQLLKTRVERLNNLTLRCNCSGPGTQTQCSADGCFDGVCIGEPCPDRTEIDRLRLVEIPNFIQELQSWRWRTFLAKSALQREYINLRLAEDVLRDSVFSPLSYETYIGLNQKITEKIIHWSDIDIIYNPLANLTGAEDPATFYIAKKGNEELIRLVENVAAPATTPAPFPEECPAGQVKPYSVCDGTECVSIDSCGTNDCDDCGNPPASCPSGESNPHSVCDGITCRSVDACGVSTCTDSGSCIAPPSNCPTGSGPCNPNNLINPFSGDYMRASAVCQGESGSNPNSLANTCGNPSVRYQEYSVGLFQMNLAVGRCNEGVTYTNPECGRANGFCTTCEIQNQVVLQGCESRYGRSSDPSVYARNITRAYELYSYSGWCPWSVGVSCGFCR